MLQDADFENSRDFLAQRFKAPTIEAEEKLRSAWNRLQSFEILKPLVIPASAAQVAR